MSPKPTREEREALHKKGSRYCNTCKAVLDLSAFTIDLGCVDGYKYNCTLCTAQNYRNWREKNREKNIPKFAKLDEVRRKLTEPE